MAPGSKLTICYGSGVTRVFAAVRLGATKPPGINALGTIVQRIVESSPATVDCPMDGVHFGGTHYTAVARMVVLWLIVARNESESPGLAVPFDGCCVIDAGVPIVKAADELALLPQPLLIRDSIRIERVHGVDVAQRQGRGGRTGYNRAAGLEAVGDYRVVSAEPLIGEIPSLFTSTIAMAPGADEAR